MPASYLSIYLTTHISCDLFYALYLYVVLLLFIYLYLVHYMLSCIHCGASRVQIIEFTVASHRIATVSFFLFFMHFSYTLTYVRTLDII